MGTVVSTNLPSVVWVYAVAPIDCPCHALTLVLPNVVAVPAPFAELRDVLLMVDGASHRNAPDRGIPNACGYYRSRGDFPKALFFQSGEFPKARSCQSILLGENSIRAYVRFHLPENLGESAAVGSSCLGVGHGRMNDCTKWADHYWRGLDAGTVVCTVACGDDVKGYAACEDWADANLGVWDYA
jgi:hypothetical protein